MEETRNELHDTERLEAELVTRPEAAAATASSAPTLTMIAVSSSSISSSLSSASISTTTMPSAEESPLVALLMRSNSSNNNNNSNMHYNREEASTAAALDVMMKHLQPMKPETMKKSTGGVISPVWSNDDWETILLELHRQYFKAEGREGLAALKQEIGKATGKYIINPPPEYLKKVILRRLINNRVYVMSNKTHTISNSRGNMDFEEETTSLRPTWRNAKGKRKLGYLGRKTMKYDLGKRYDWRECNPITGTYVPFESDNPLKTTTVTIAHKIEGRFERVMKQSIQSRIKSFKVLLDTVEDWTDYLEIPPPRRDIDDDDDGGDDDDDDEATEVQTIELFRHTISSRRKQLAKYKTDDDDDDENDDDDDDDGAGGGDSVPAEENTIDLDTQPSDVNVDVPMTSNQDSSGGSKRLLTEHEGTAVSHGTTPTANLPVTPNFATRLYDMLDGAEQQQQTTIVSWCPDGRSFRIHQPDKMLPLLGQYFRQTNYKSLLRQLQWYSFSRMTKRERNGTGTISHPYFRRGHRSLCFAIKRKRAPGKSVSSKEQREQLANCKTAVGDTNVPNANTNAMVMNTNINTNNLQQWAQEFLLSQQQQQQQQQLQNMQMVQQVLRQAQQQQQQDLLPVMRQADLMSVSNGRIDVENVDGSCNNHNNSNTNNTTNKSNNNLNSNNTNNTNNTNTNTTNTDNDNDNNNNFQNEQGSSSIIVNEYDVIFGRGRGARDHTGNLKCKYLVEKRMEEYNAGRRNDKTKIAEQIVTMVLDSGGRFLKKDIRKEWHEVTRKEMRDKVAHFFRRTRRQVSSSSSRAAGVNNNANNNVDGYNNANGGAGAGTGGGFFVVEDGDDGGDDNEFVTNAFEDDDETLGDNTAVASLSSSHTTNNPVFTSSVEVSEYIAGKTEEEMEYAEFDDAVQAMNYTLLPATTATRATRSAVTATTAAALPKARTPGSTTMTTTATKSVFQTLDEDDGCDDNEFVTNAFEDDDETLGDNTAVASLSSSHTTNNFMTYTNANANANSSSSVVAASSSSHTTMKNTTTTKTNITVTLNRMDVILASSMDALDPRRQSIGSNRLQVLVAIQSGKYQQSTPEAKETILDEVVQTVNEFWKGRFLIEVSDGFYQILFKSVAKRSLRLIFDIRSGQDLFPSANATAMVSNVGNGLNRSNIRNSSQSAHRVGGSMPNGFERSSAIAASSSSHTTMTNTTTTKTNTNTNTYANRSSSTVAASSAVAASSSSHSTMTKTTNINTNSYTNAPSTDEDDKALLQKVTDDFIKRSAPRVGKRKKNGKKWSIEEVVILIKQRKLIGRNDWYHVSTFLPDRTNKDVGSKVQWLKENTNLLDGIAGIDGSNLNNNENYNINGSNTTNDGLGMGRNSCTTRGVLLPPSSLSSLNEHKRMRRKNDSFGFESVVSVKLVGQREDMAVYLGDEHPTKDGYVEIKWVTRKSTEFVPVTTISNLPSRGGRRRRTNVHPDKVNPEPALQSDDEVADVDEPEDIDDNTPVELGDEREEREEFTAADGNGNNPIVIDDPSDKDDIIVINDSDDDNDSDTSDDAHVAPINVDDRKAPFSRGEMEIVASPLSKSGLKLDRHNEEQQRPIESYTDNHSSVSAIANAQATITSTRFRTRKRCTNGRKRTRLKNNDNLSKKRVRARISTPKNWKDNTLPSTPTIESHAFGTHSMKKNSDAFKTPITSIRRPRRLAYDNVFKTKSNN